MIDLQIDSHPSVKLVFDKYPEEVRTQLIRLRELVLESARELDGISTLEETLKWGEPSYLVKKGSTIRMDWKPKAPDQYAMYFKCTSRLVETFKTVYGDLFDYEGTRAIVFKQNEKIPVQELKQCIKAALRYHKIKHLPTLGIL
jgi:hypothetical protein